jgi:hypothetical protein
MLAVRALAALRDMRGRQLLLALGQSQAPAFGCRRCRLYLSTLAQCISTLPCHHRRYHRQQQLYTLQQGLEVQLLRPQEACT